MHASRRSMLCFGASLVGAGLAAGGPTARAAPRRATAQLPSAFGIDAATLGVRAGSSDDQSALVQRAIDQTAQAGSPLAFAPGLYRVGGLKLPSGAQLVAPRGAVRFLLAGGSELLGAENADRITLSGLVLDGLKVPLVGDGRGLVRFLKAGQLKISDCEIVGAGGHAVLLDAVSGEVVDTAITEARDTALLSFDARGLLVGRNTITRAGDNGIQIFRRSPGDDGTLVVDNRIDGINNRSGGNGPYGNGINVFRSGNVTVRGNRIANCAFSGIRGNSASNITMIGNTVTEMGETAIYSEFSFEGAVIANNIVEGAQTGISVTNFNEGGRLGVVAGNIIRNLARRPANPSPDGFNGIGIAVEADAAVTGNVVERADAGGILVGWGRYLRDVAVTGNVVRDSGFGVGVSVSEGAGSVLIASNVFSGSARGAVVGLEHAQIVTGDLTRDGAAQFPHLTISGNRVS
ncbi:MAG: TIGR03808 family TAT-translocated repetitive protein [Xanthobacteraceae bacterium]